MSIGVAHRAIRSEVYSWLSVFWPNWPDCHAFLLQNSSILPQRTQLAVLLPSLISPHTALTFCWLCCLCWRAMTVRCLHTTQPKSRRASSAHLCALLELPGSFYSNTASLSTEVSPSFGPGLFVPYFSVPRYFTKSGKHCLLFTHEELSHQFSSRYW